MRPNDDEYYDELKTWYDSKLKEMLSYKPRAPTAADYTNYINAITAAHRCINCFYYCKYAGCFYERRPDAPKCPSWKIEDVTFEDYVNRQTAGRLIIKKLKSHQNARATDMPWEPEQNEVPF